MYNMQMSKRTMAGSPRTHTFITYNDIYKEDVDEEGNPTSSLVHRNKKLKYSCYLDNIFSVTQCVNPEGKTLKNKCRIFHETDGPIIVRGNFQEIHNLVFHNEEKQIGFRNNKDK